MLILIISKLVELKNNFNYLIGYSYEVIRTLVLVLSKLSGYIKTSKDKGVDKNENNKLMSLHIGNDKLLEEYKTIWSKIEDLKNIYLSP